MLATLAVYVHAINPNAIDLGFWQIRWYGLSYLAGFIVAWLMIRRAARVGVSSLNYRHAGDMVVTLAIGAVVGGRLGYVLFYEPNLFTQFYNHLPYWGLLAINKGGMASHGGITGVIIAAWLFARRGPIKEGTPDALTLPAKGTPAKRDAGRIPSFTPPPDKPQPRTRRHRWGHIMDLAALGTPIGLFFGRLANFVNGELFGRPCSPNLPWAVAFPQEVLHWTGERLAALGPAVQQIDPNFNALDWARDTALYDPTASDAFSAGATRRVLEQAEHVIDATQHPGPHRQAVIDALRPVLTPRHPSQLYEALLEGVVVLIVLLIVWRKPRKPGVLGGWFAVAYATVRIIAEFTREPDFQLRNAEFGHWGITRGQMLSLPLLALGVFLIWWNQRMDKPRMGGWRRVPSQT